MKSLSVKVLTGGAVVLLCSAIAHANDRIDTPVTKDTCNASAKQLAGRVSSQELREIYDMAASGALSSAFRFALERDSLITDIRKKHGDTEFSRLMLETGKSLSADQRSFLNSSINYQESLNKKYTQKYLSKSYEHRNEVSDIVFCGLQNIYFDPEPLEKGYQRVATESFRSAKFDHFNIGIKNCSVSKMVGTGSSFSEPEHWDGSQFVIIDATLKNEDSEGRLPFEGELVIKQPNGKMLRYDHSETVMADGYGIGLRPVNPFVTMPTKIVYRIPSDITGEVLWQPGRNPESRRLWCTFLYEGAKP
ncbi:hypothetical protein ACQKEK_00770 [Pseudomonas sp. NPDC077408]